jgi:CRP-like cAMP-binding protein
VLDSADSHSTRRLLERGEEGKAFYLIIDGEVQLLANGHVTRLAERDFFGEMSNIDGAPQVTTLVTVTEMLTMQLERGPFGGMIGSDPSVSLGIMKELVSTVCSLEDGYGRPELQDLTHAAVGHAPYG